LGKVLTVSCSSRFGVEGDIERLYSTGPVSDSTGKAFIGKGDSFTNVESNIRSESCSEAEELLAELKGVSLGGSSATRELIKLQPLEVGRMDSRMKPSWLKNKIVEDLLRSRRVL